MRLNAQNVRQIIKFLQISPNSSTTVLLNHRVEVGGTLASKKKEKTFLLFHVASSSSGWGTANPVNQTTAGTRQWNNNANRPPTSNQGQTKNGNSESTFMEVIS